MEYQPKNVLITGAAGFIGSNFVRYYLGTKPNIKILSLDKLTYAGSLKNLDNLSAPTRHSFIQGDICDYNLLMQLMHEYSIDTIVHFAAESHVDRSIVEPAPFIQTNIVGTFTLLEVARKVWLDEKGWNAENCRFHHISTDEVYGDLLPTDEPFTEHTPYAPSSPYSASKASSDHLVRAYFRTYEVPVTLSNCSNNYGPYQHQEKLIPTVIRACLEQKPIPVYGNGSNVRDWLYVEDHCQALELILQKGVVGETYNVGGNCEKDNLSLVKILCKLMDEKIPEHAPYDRLITFVTDRKGHDRRYGVNVNKISQTLQWRSQYDLRVGLRRTIEYFLQLFRDSGD